MESIEYLFRSNQTTSKLFYHHEYVCSVLIQISGFVFFRPDVLIREHKHIVSTRLKPIIRQICGKIEKTPTELEKFYRTLISGILIYSGVGSPTRVSVIREAAGKIVYISEYLQTLLYLALVW